jgi:hypothetical protein
MKERKRCFGLRKILGVFASLAVLALGLFAFSKPALASEGTAELRSLTDKNYSCFATSILTESGAYKILITCRDLIYPPEVDKFAYVAWGTPLEGEKPIRLGELEKGKASFQANKAFSEIFVTVETNGNINKPSGQTVMRGVVNPIAFSGGGGEAITTPTISTTATVTPTTNQDASSLGEKLKPTLGRVFLVIFIVFLVIIVLAVVFSRARKPYSP